jgi:hypothetical protein
MHGFLGQNHKKGFLTQTRVLNIQPTKKKDGFDDACKHCVT